MLFAFLWWGIQRYTAMKRGLVVRTAQAKIEKEYQEAIRRKLMRNMKQSKTLVPNVV